VAGEWRSRAIASDESSGWYDDQLDAVVALLRVADVWEQRNPAGSAVGFASELLAGSVPIDTISRVGVRPGGVEVLTPAQAMGRHWQVVVLAGLQDGAWPNLRLRDRILRADLLADVGAGRVAVGEDGREELIDSTRAARRAVLDDEYRLFVAAVTRSRSIVHAGAVRSEDAAPSAFFALVARLAGTHRENDIVPVDPVEAPLSLSGHIADLRARAANSDERLAAPGTRRIYSNRGIEILGERLEEATGTPLETWVETTVLEPLGMASVLIPGSPAHSGEGSARDLSLFARELAAPRLVSPALAQRARTPVLPGLDGVLPGYGRQTPNPFGLGVEVRGAKSPHWTGAGNSEQTFGHFGQSGSFIWVDPVAERQAVFLGARPFGAVHRRTWSELGDQILAL